MQYNNCIESIDIGDLHFDGISNASIEAACDTDYDTKENHIQSLLNAEGEIHGITSCINHKILMKLFGVNRCEKCGRIIVIPFAHKDGKIMCSKCVIKDMNDENKKFHKKSKKATVSICSGNI